ncbi:MAG TPA: hypothetical protein VGD43_03485 [Micromonospora sp.]
MLPFALTHPLWWVACRSARFLSVLAFVVALGAGGSPALPSTPVIAGQTGPPVPRVTVAVPSGAAHLAERVTVLRAASQVTDPDELGDNGGSTGDAVRHEPGVHLVPPHRSPVSGRSTSNSEPGDGAYPAPPGQRAPPRG